MDTSAMERLKSRCKNIRILYIEDDELRGNIRIQF